MGMPLVGSIAPELTAALHDGTPFDLREVRPRIAAVEFHRGTW